MYTRILVPLDGSELAERILPCVRSIAAWSHASVELLSVIDNADFTGSGRSEQQYLDLLCARAATAAEKYLGGMATGLSLPAGEVWTAVRIGNVADTILEQAEREPNTLVAMSTHGRSGLSRTVLGSMADKVLQGSSAPLLLFHPPERDMVGTSYLAQLIVPLDGSDLAAGVLPHAAAVAKSLHLHVTLVTVTPSTLQQVVDFGGWDGEFAANPLAGVDEWAEQYLLQQAVAVKAMGVTGVTTRHLKGDAGRELVELVRATPNSMVALATHGRSGLRRAALGSVANRVVRQAGVPTLVIRPHA